jgi:nicotinamide-nucleotide amidase
MGPGTATRAAIVTVGNELLFGETVDTNAAWLGRKLSSKGIEVVRRFTVGDVDADIRAALDAAMIAADLVLVTGGLGPTPDDRTKPVVAAHFGLPMVEDRGVRQDVEARFRSAGLDEVPPRSRGQYRVPEGARALRNPVGTAPGLLLERAGKAVALFPGVPAELRAIVQGDFDDVLERFAGRAVRHRVVHTTGIFETKLAEALEPAVEELPEDLREAVALAYLPDVGGVDLRLTVRGAEAAEAEALFDAWLDGVSDVLEPWRFEAESGDVAGAVVSALRATSRTLAVAESCTGGLLGARVTAVPGASDVFLGGIIAYANEAKVGQVGVSEASLAAHGAVSEAVARELASGVADRFGADVGVGITGVAGPGGGTEEKPVGTVWIAVGVDGEVDAWCTRFPGGRTEIRERAAQSALTRVLRRVSEARRG